MDINIQLNSKGNITASYKTFVQLRAIVLRKIALNNSETEIIPLGDK